MATFKVADINGWIEGLSCTPTALAALTGKTPEEVATFLAKAAEENGRSIGVEIRQDYAIPDWLTAVDRMGGKWSPGDDFSGMPLSARPTIAEWMFCSPGVEPELVFCDDGAKVGHVFVTEGGDVVDTYTEGKRIKFIAVPEEYQSLRVKLTFLVD